MSKSATSPGTCPFRGTRVGGTHGDGPRLDDWYPDRLRVELLNRPSEKANPLGSDFDYGKAFDTLDLEAVKQDIFAMLTDSKDWWPADYGNYGPQMIRMAWHAAGTYRIADGRGGAGQGLQRLLPISSWVDNGNIDKSRRLLWPIKHKYGRRLSWSDLMVLTGNCALEIMGFETLGFAGGREDAWEHDIGTYWGPEAEMQGRARWEGDPTAEHYDLENPLGASEMSLIYVNPEGPGGNSDPASSAREIRETFGRMAMNDIETVALIAGGHAFGKSHGAVSAEHVGPPPDAESLETQGFGWINSAGTGHAEYTRTNGIEGAWTSKPTHWDDEYLRNLFDNEWELIEGPGGAKQWRPVKGKKAGETPDAHIEGKTHSLMMMTSDLALKVDPTYNKICKDFLADKAHFEREFAKAWYKLTHRDMGPLSRYRGDHVPKETFIWQDPVPDVDHPLVDDRDIAALKNAILASGVTVSMLVSAAWASASTYRDSDKRGGANGARVRLAPQNDWEVNNPPQLSKTLAALQRVQSDFNGKGNKRVSLADLIVLGGAAAVEKAAKDAGVKVTVPFTAGRTDATDEHTDVESFEWLHPVADGFRNFEGDGLDNVKAEELLLDRANLLTLSAPEMTVLVGGLRVLGANWDDSKHGVFTDKPGVLTNDFFANLLDMRTKWETTDDAKNEFVGKDRQTGEQRWTATRVDLVFGHESALRAICEVYGAKDALPAFVRDFVSAWTKVMMLDRYDVDG